MGTLTYKTGNLLDATEPFIVHGCHARGVMGSGVALAVKTMYPEAYEEYRRFCADRPSLHDVLGHNVIVPVKLPTGEDRFVVNAITQRHFGNNGAKYVSYDAVDECLYRLTLAIRTSGRFGPGDFPDIAMPKIGAGLGGGNWETIEAIIGHRLKEHNVVIYVL